MKRMIVNKRSWMDAKEMVLLRMAGRHHTATTGQREKSRFEEKLFYSHSNVKGQIKKYKSTGEAEVLHLDLSKDEEGG